jgi:DNA-3-methyladenine glycosylase II
VPETLTEARLREQAALLAQREPAFHGVLARLGTPPMWARTPGFATLVHIILEQQVSLASARAAFERLKLALDAVSPQAFLSLDDAQLLAIGFSRQKARYCRELAQAVLEGHIDLDGLAEREDTEVRAALVALKGIGPWTAEIYLLMVLLRPDAWPKGDIALASAAREVFSLSEVPSQEALALRAEDWRPHRAVAARLLWQHSLSK